MPARRKGTFPTYELRPDDNASKVKDSHGTMNQNQGKRGAGKDISRPGPGGHEQVDEPQQGNKATGRRQASSRRGSNVPALEKATPTPKAAHSALKVKGRIDSLSAHLDCTLMATSSECKQGQTLNLRTSTRTRKAVCYNEQSPSHLSNNKPPTASKPKARAATKTSAPSASSAAKRVQKDPASLEVGTAAVPSETNSHLKRGRTSDEELGLLQSRDKSSAAALKANKVLLFQETLAHAPVTTSHLKRGRTRDQGPKLLQRQEEYSAIGVNSDQILLRQSTARMRTKPLKEQNLEPVTNKETKCKMESVDAKADTAHNQREKQISTRLTRPPQEQKIAADSTGLKSQPMDKAKGRGKELPTSEVVVEESVQVHPLEDGSQNRSTLKEKKSSNKQITTGNTAQNTKVCLPDAFNVEPNEMCDFAPSTKADKKVSLKAQKKGRKTVPLERASTALQVEKESNVCVGIVVDEEKGGVLESIIDKKPSCQTEGKGRGIVARNRPSFEKRPSFETRGNEMGNITVIDGAQIEISQDVKLVLKCSEQGGVQEFGDGDKVLHFQKQEKGRKTVKRKRTLPASGGDDMENVLVSPETFSVLAKADCGTTIDTKPEDVYGTYKSSSGDKKLQIETQKNEKKAVSRKRTLQGAAGKQEQVLETPMIQVASTVQSRNDFEVTAMDHNAQRERSTVKRTGSTQVVKKLKTNMQSLAILEPYVQTLVQEAENVESKELIKTIQGVVSQDWTANDLTNLGIKVESSSLKKRKEEGKRKKAMKFDALPVGFGLGISCWSPSPLKCQGLKLQEVTGLSEVQDLVIDNQFHSSYSGGEAEKQPYPQTVAMLADEDMEAKPKNVYAIPGPTAELSESNVPQNDDAKGVYATDSGSIPDKSLKFRGKLKVKRQVGGRAKKTSALLVSSPKSVATSDDHCTLDGKSLESGINRLKTKMQQSSRNAAGKRITRSTKQ